jgi:hypothetical protein
MIFRVGIENDNDGRSIAWALEHPGCFAYGKDSAQALGHIADAVRQYMTWIGRHGGAKPSLAGDVEITNEETFDVYYVDEAFERVEQGHGSMVESFFRHDWKPLTATDIENALMILAWTRADLLTVVDGLSAERLGRKMPGERWDINGILNHIGGAEWWYQERIGYPSPPEEDDLPADPFERLADTRKHFTVLLPSLQGLNRVIGLDGELWSPRKVLRRLVWHERDHTDHIGKLL